MTREAWLDGAVEALRPVFLDRTDLEVPRVHVSTGWPSKGGTARKKRVIGECWYHNTSTDEVPHIFISPMLENAVDVLGVLVHELVHATVGPGLGHKAGFARPARAMGLEGKMTETNVDNVLREILEKIAVDLGQYEHAAIEPGGGNTAEPKQGTRQLKVVAACCGYIVRTTRKWLDEGLPSCPCGNQMEEAT